MCWMRKSRVLASAVQKRFGCAGSSMEHFARTVFIMRHRWNPLDATYWWRCFSSSGVVWPIINGGTKVCEMLISGKKTPARQSHEVWRRRSHPRTQLQARTEETSSRNVQTVRIRLGESWLVCLSGDSCVHAKRVVVSSITARTASSSKCNGGKPEMTTPVRLQMQRKLEATVFLFDVQFAVYLFLLCGAARVQTSCDSELPARHFAAVDLERRLGRRCDARCRHWQRTRPSRAGTWSCEAGAGGRMVERQMHEEQLSTRGTLVLCGATESWRETWSVQVQTLHLWVVCPQTIRELKNDLQCSLFQVFTCYERCNTRNLYADDAQIGLEVYRQHIVLTTSGMELTDWGSTTAAQCEKRICEGLVIVFLTETLGGLNASLLADGCRRRKGGEATRVVACTQAEELAIHPFSYIWLSCGKRSHTKASCLRATVTVEQQCCCLHSVGMLWLASTCCSETGFDVKDLMKEIVHVPGRGAHPVKVVFRDTYKLKLKKELFVTAEDT